MANISILTGRLTADPELKQTPNGVAVTSFSIAVPRSYAPKNGERQTDFIDIVAWRNQAEFICKYFTKGRWIEIIGSIEIRTYVDKEGKNRRAFEIIAKQANFVGDKPKDETSSGAGAALPPAPPKSVDPFAKGMSPSRHIDDFVEPEYDDDGDLPF